MKQAWNLLRRERLFSAVYILGTGLSIAVVMLLSIVCCLKVADVYPEMHRDRMLVVKRGLMVSNGGKTQQSGGLSLQMIRQLLTDLPGVEALGFYRDTYVDGGSRVQLPGGEMEQMPVRVLPVNAGFWSVYSFRFLSGKPFMEADERSGLPVAVVSASLARRLFGEADAVGRDCVLNLRNYRIVGVVQDVSPITESSYASVWIPYTVIPGYAGGAGDPGGMIGRLHATLLVRRGIDPDEVCREVDNRLARLNSTWGGEMSFSLMGQPDRYWQSIFRGWSNEPIDLPKVALRYVLLFLILLLVPAISLSGMTDSRMERRLAEMGVRRAFGAPVVTLIRQVVVENLVFTLLGGVAGLLFSYLLFFLTKGWVMQLVGSGLVEVMPEGTEVQLTPSMLLNPAVFGIALGVCLVLNLLSALVPAWRAARREIIHSLNKQK